jgi:hypothetical protein
VIYLVTSRVATKIYGSRSQLQVGLQLRFSLVASGVLSEIVFQL